MDLSLGRGRQWARGDIPAVIDPAPAASGALPHGGEVAVAVVGTNPRTRVHRRSAVAGCEAVRGPPTHSFGGILLRQRLLRPSCLRREHDRVAFGPFAKRAPLADALGVGGKGALGV